MNRTGLSIEKRYENDPAIRALVNSLEDTIRDLVLTPSEIRECAMLACIHYEQHKTPGKFMEECIAPTKQCTHSSSTLKRAKRSKGKHAKQMCSQSSNG